MRFLQKIFFLSIVLIAVSIQSRGSHIRAGEIIAENINNSPLTWQFTLIMYTDLASDVRSTEVEFDFGDGSPSQIVSRTSFLDLGNGTGQNTYLVNHTFTSSAGTRFTVSATEENRNACIINFDNSINSPFHIATEIVLDAGVGINATPRFSEIPVVNATIGQKWIFDNGGFDPDPTDSISYELIVPKLSEGIDVLNYRDPVSVSGGLTEDGSAPAFLTLDPVTGVITWDAPNIQGCFNIAFRIVEWKLNPLNNTYIRRSTVTRDMQIIVDDIDNLRPIINAPADTCVIAGSTLFLKAIAFDQNVPPDFLYLSASGEPFLLDNSPALFTPSPDDSVRSPAELNVQWTTECIHIRKKPYRFVFKVEDARPDMDKLTDFDETNVVVIGPAPQLDTAIVQNNRIELNWQPYLCTNARTMAIYRRKGDYATAFDSCFTGAPSGFEKIGSVNINVTNFVDGLDNDLEKGPKYCYRLVAEFPDEAESRPSNEECGALPLNVPLLTNIDVDQTSGQGVINLAWTRPFELDSIVNPPPYRYEVFGNTDANQIATFNQLEDTTFIWNPVNTEDTSNRVVLKFITSDTNEETPNSAGNSIWLRTTPGGKRVFLEWGADVPWSNNGFYHLIYRQNNSTGVFELIDSVFAENDTYSYLDQSPELIDGIQYCYYIETRGSYFNDLFSKILFNRSQIACDIPRDSTPPCPPILTIENINCDSLFAEKQCGDSINIEKLPDANLLRWQPDLSEGCDTSIASYNIFFRGSQEEEFQFLANVPFDVTLYEHDLDGKLTGCYVVTALDSFANESDFSNEVCRETCNYFELPNVFVPNQDKGLLNEKFRPCRNAMSSVKNINFVVYNRWGQKVRTIENNPRIDWDGLDEDGIELPAGYYFYQADVEFFKLNPEDAAETFKGWVLLMR